MALQFLYTDYFGDLPGDVALGGTQFQAPYLIWTLLPKDTFSLSSLWRKFNGMDRITNLCLDDVEADGHFTDLLLQPLLHVLLGSNVGQSVRWRLQTPCQTDMKCMGSVVFGSHKIVLVGLAVDLIRASRRAPASAHVNAVAMASGGLVVELWIAKCFGGLITCEKQLIENVTVGPLDAENEEPARTVKIRHPLEARKSRVKRTRAAPANPGR